MAEHKHAEVLRAIADGKVGQWQDGDDWIDGSESVNPLKFPSLNWRVKPEPKPDVVQWLCGRDHFLKWHAYDGKQHGDGTFHQIKIVKDGETGKLKSVEIVE